MVRRLRRWFPRFFRAKPAPSGARSVDMSGAITMLDPDTSQFTTMLLRLQNQSNLPPKPDPDAWAPEWDDGLISPEARAAYQYFLNHGGYDQGLYVKFKTKVRWLEDQLFPRLTRGSAQVVEQTNHPYFKRGDIVRIT